MQRRHFLTTIANAAFGFAILPAAETYVRRLSGVLVPTNDPLVRVVIYNVREHTCSYSWKRWSQVGQPGDTPTGVGVLLWTDLEQTITWPFNQQVTMV